MIVRDKLREELWLSGAYSVEQNPSHCSALLSEIHENDTTKSLNSIRVGNHSWRIFIVGAHISRSDVIKHLYHDVRVCDKFFFVAKVTSHLGTENRKAVSSGFCTSLYLVCSAQGYQTSGPNYISMTNFNYFNISLTVHLNIFIY